MKYHVKPWHTYEKIALAIFTTTLFVLAFYRSVLLDYTNDEAYSFLNVDKFDLNMMFGTANTHWFNSVFMFFENLLGNAEWILRLHSSLAIVLFSYFILRTFKHNFSNWLLLIPITLLICNHYLFDFFSLSRGYALAMMFQIMAFYTIVHHRNHTFKIYLYLSLATFSNYTFIYILYAYALCDLIDQFTGKSIDSYTAFNFYVHRIPLLLISFYAIPNIFYIKYYTGDLEEGLTNGYIPDTLQHFFQLSYWHIPPILIYWGLLVWNLFMLVFYFYFNSTIKTGFKRLFTIYFIVVVLIYVLYYLLHIPFPYGRTSFFQIILFLFLTAYMIVFLLQKLPTVFQIILPIFLFTANLIYITNYRDYRITLEWWMQQGLKKFHNDLHQIAIQESAPIKIGMSIDHYGSMNNYYNYLKPIDINYFIYSRRRYDEMQAELIPHFAEQNYLLMVNDYGKFLDTLIPKENIQLIQRYPNMKSDLLKVTHPIDSTSNH
jgi:hypothetical protein